MTTPINVEELDKILDWTFRLTFREAVAQGVFKGKEINITEQMLTGAKAEARRTISTYITNKLIEEFRNITRPNYAGIYGTYDYDGIAEAVIERVKELEALRATLSNTIEGEK